MDSPYLRHVPLSKAKRNICFYCGCHMDMTPGFLNYYRPRYNSKTKDHVRLRSHHSGVSWHTLNILNYRPCCYRCNQLRSDEAEHCVGVLMMALMMSEERGLTFGNPNTIAATLVNNPIRIALRNLRRQRRARTKKLRQKTDEILQKNLASLV